MKKVTVYSLSVYKIETSDMYDISLFLKKAPSREDVEKQLNEFGIKVNEFVLNSLLKTGIAKSEYDIGLPVFLRLSSDDYTIDGDIIQRVND